MERCARSGARGDGGLLPSGVRAGSSHRAGRTPEISPPAPGLRKEDGLLRSQAGSRSSYASVLVNPVEDVMALVSEQTAIRIDNAGLSLAPDALRVAERSRVWRPFSEQVAHFLCLEDAPGGVAPRIHGRFAIMLFRSPAFVTVESSRSLVAERNHVLLMPRSQLFTSRARGDAGPGPATLLLDASDLEGLAVPERPALVSDAECGAQVAALIGQLQRPVGLVGREPISRSLLERLFARAVPLGRGRSWSGRSLAPVRQYLHANLRELIPTAALAAHSRP